MHPSLNADFIPPPALQPRERMPVNEACWCGSGKKWKKCHRDREHQTPVPIGKLLADHQVQMAQGYCLHPQATPDTCSPIIINAHTIQRRGGLAAISENGHVISPKLGFRDIAKNDGKLIPRRHGIKDASTFPGFCATHDEQLFQPIEKSPMVLSQQAAFLLSFRAICYEKLTKDGALRAVEIQQQADKGDPFEIQCEKQQHIHFYREGLKRGVNDLEGWKREYDAAFLKGSYDEFSFYGLMFSTPLPIVACGSFCPDFDLNRNCLQIITNGHSKFEHLSFNLTVVQGKSLAVFGSTGMPQGPAKLFVESFRALPKDTMANAVFHIACEYLENIYFRPSWWESQTNSVREHLVGRFRSGMGWGNPERRPDCLSQFDYNLANSTVELELSS